jgi:hypothetical protein
MRASTELTYVPVFAQRCLIPTLSFIPEAAWVGLSPGWAVSLLHFLIRTGAAFASAMSLEMTCFEVAEFVELVKGYIVDGSHMFPDGSIEVKDL